MLDCELEICERRVKWRTRSLVLTIFKFIVMGVDCIGDDGCSELCERGGDRDSKEGGGVSGRAGCEECSLWDAPELGSYGKCQR